MLDGNSRQNLATFCQTWVDDEIRELMDLSIDKNMIDKDEYPQTAEIEARCVKMLADLWNSPSPETTLGCSTIGSSEAAMLGGLALKWQWRKKRAALGLPADKPNLVCGPVQICWHKFARYFDVELREIPLEGDRLIMSPEEVLTGIRLAVKKNTDSLSSGKCPPVRSRRSVSVSRAGIRLRGGVTRKSLPGFPGKPVCISGGLTQDCTRKS